MVYSLTEGELNLPAEPILVNELSAEFGVNFPREYLEFLLLHDGCEGFIGENYIILWGVKELAEFNREYEVDKYAPGIILFGSDGGGEGYGFDTEAATMPIVRIPFIGMGRRYATPVAKDFPELFAKLGAHRE